MTDIDRHRQRGWKPALRLTALWLLLAWLGNASVAAWDAFEYPYNDHVNFIEVFGDMLSLPIASLFSTSLNEVGLPLVNEVMFLSLVLTVGAHLARFSSGLLIAAAAITVPYALLGLTTFSGFVADGEWLAEGWAHLQAFTLWSIIIGVYTAATLRRPLVSRSSPAVA